MGNDRIEINEEHLGTDATRRDVEAVMSALKKRGYNVVYGPGAGWPGANSDERVVFERIWDECIAAGAPARSEPDE